MGFLWSFVDARTTYAATKTASERHRTLRTFAPEAPSLITDRLGRACTEAGTDDRHRGRTIDRTSGGGSQFCTRIRLYLLETKRLDLYTHYTVFEFGGFTFDKAPGLRIAAPLGPTWV